MNESQSWVTSRAQEMFQKSVPENWNPDRPYPDDHHDSHHNPQVISEVLRSEGNFVLFRSEFKFGLEIVKAVVTISASLSLWY